MCFLFKVLGSKIGIYERKLCKAEEGEPPMDDQSQLRDPAASENMSSLYFVYTGTGFYYSSLVTF